MVNKETIKMIFCHANKPKCVCCTVENNEVVYDVNLTDGSSFVAPGSSISYYSALSGHTSQCSKQGVIRITYPPLVNGAQSRYLQFDLYFDTSLLTSAMESWNFNIADSLFSNGYGGLGAEVHNIGLRFPTFALVMLIIVLMVIY